MSVTLLARQAQAHIKPRKVSCVVLRTRVYNVGPRSMKRLGNDPSQVQYRLQSLRGHQGGGTMSVVAGISCVRNSNQDVVLVFTGCANMKIEFDFMRGNRITCS